MYEIVNKPKYYKETVVGKYSMVLLALFILLKTKVTRRYIGLLAFDGVLFTSSFERLKLLRLEKKTSDILPLL